MLTIAVGMLAFAATTMMQSKPRNVFECTSMSHTPREPAGRSSPNGHHRQAGPADPLREGPVHAAGALRAAGRRSRIGGGIAVPSTGAAAPVEPVRHTVA